MFLLYIIQIYTNVAKLKHRNYFQKSLLQRKKNFAAINSKRCFLP